VCSTALQGEVFQKNLLQRMACAILATQTFDGDDMGAIRLHREREARARGTTIHGNRAGAAHAVFAAQMRAGQMQMLAQKVRQRKANRHGLLVNRTIHGNADAAFPSQLPLPRGRAPFPEHARRARPRDACDMRKMRGHRRRDRHRPTTFAAASAKRSLHCFGPSRRPVSVLSAACARNGPFPMPRMVRRALLTGLVSHRSATLPSPARRQR